MASHDNHYSELATALGSDEMDSHAGRLDRARRAAKALEACKTLEEMLGPKGRERFVMQGAMMFGAVHRVVQAALATPTVKAQDQKRSESTDRQEDTRAQWVELTLRLLTRLHPCKACTFELSTMARKDVIFGVGQPELCVACAERRTRDEDETWIRTFEHVPVLVRSFLGAILDK